MQLSDTLDLRFKISRILRGFVSIGKFMLYCIALQNIF